MFLLTIEKPETYAPFDGDGRTKVRPNGKWAEAFPGAQPISMTRAAARKLIFEFWRNGDSRHSPQGNTFWVLASWARMHKLPIKVVKHPYGGWYVKLLLSDEEEEVGDAYIH